MKIHTPRQRERSDFVKLNGLAAPRQDRKTIYEVLGRESVHPFPARMAPGIALELVGQSKNTLRILDPMMGSGTVLALARSRGHRAIGLDIDPLAVLIAKVWTSSVNVPEVRRKAAVVLERARRIECTLRDRDAYPIDADRETRKFVAYWFDRCARRQLRSLATAIKRVRDDVTRDALWCSFSRLIIAKQAGASLAMDLAHSRPHRAFKRAPAKPFQKFLDAAKRVSENCIDRRSTQRGPAATAFEGDARQLPFADETIDVVLTSPPYLNAIDYLRCSKFSLVWMGHSVTGLREIRATSVGTEVGRGAPINDKDIRTIIGALRLRPDLPARSKGMLAQYINDMRLALAEVSRVLIHGGRAVYVVGENSVRGTYIRNASIITWLASTVGLELCASRTRTLPPDRRYLPPPSRNSQQSGLNVRLRREIVLSFTKRRTLQ
jgi:tRNA G10  N-methylase Trm11